MSDDIEVPFPADPECLLTVTGGIDWITFIDPKPNAWGKHHRSSLPVTIGPTVGDHPTLGNVWHYEIDGDTLVTSPSVHAVGCWHSPNPTRWRIVEKLADE